MDMHYMNMNFINMHGHMNVPTPKYLAYPVCDPAFFFHTHLSFIPIPIMHILFIFIIFIILIILIILMFLAIFVLPICLVYYFNAFTKPFYLKIKCVHMHRKYIMYHLK